MQPHDLEKLILLDQSGELSPREKSRLEQALKSSAAGRDFQRTLNGLVQPSAPAEPGETARSAAARLAAKAAADKQAGVTIPFPRPMAAVAACAALALILAGIWTRLSTGPSSDREPDRLDRLQTIIAIFSEQDIEFVGGEVASDRERLRAVAQDLLMMEGLTLDEVRWEEEPETEPDPTTRQSHSTHAPRAAEYV